MSRLRVPSTQQHHTAIFRRCTSFSTISWCPREVPNAKQLLRSSSEHLVGGVVEVDGTNNVVVGQGSETGSSVGVPDFTGEWEGTS